MPSPPKFPHGENAAVTCVVIVTVSLALLSNRLGLFSRGREATRGIRSVHFSDILIRFCPDCLAGKGKKIPQLK